MITSILKNLGLSKREIKVYLQMIELGTQAASIIARKLRIPRSSARLILDLLVDKNFLTKSTKKNTQFYSPISPNNVIALLKVNKKEKDQFFNETIQKFSLISPELESLMNTNISLPKVQLFEGIEGIKSLYLQVLDARKDIDSIEETGDLYQKFIPQFADYFIRERIKRKLNNRCIFPYTETSILRNFNAPELLRYTRSLPVNEFPFCCDIKIYGSNVSIVTFDEKAPMGIIISHPKIAENFHLMFKFMWKAAEKYDVLKKG